MPAIRSIPVYHRRWKLFVVCLIAAIGVVTGWTIHHFSRIDPGSQPFDWVVYDWLFRRRPVQDRTNGPIVLVVEDDWSLALVSKYIHQEFPWPRVAYTKVIEAAEEAGAREVVFDMTFDKPSFYDKESDDSASLAATASKAKIPVIFGVQTTSDPRSPYRFALTLDHPILGAVNLSTESTILRWYYYSSNTLPTLALAAASQIDPSLVAYRNDPPFLIHYYGPFGSVDKMDASNRPTHARISIADLIIPRFLPPGAAIPAEIRHVDSAQLKGKIVVIGSIANELFDLKSSPYSPRYPGVDYQATAIENLLTGDRVYLAAPLAQYAALIVPCLAAALATIFLRTTVMKFAIPLAIGGVLLLITYELFRHSPIVFLTPIPPLCGLIVSMITGVLASYFFEGRQRLFLSRAFGNYVSPAVVEELERNPAALTLGGRRKAITILFSDIRSFTTISEKMPTEQVEVFMNTYLGAMTDVVMAEKGTVDKYIGDAVMAFWNAPLDQPDHPTCAAKTALRMLACEREKQPLLQSLTGEEVYTRIGIATGDVMVGNFGSAEKINYTVLGDSVNLASRLEGANKIYGSQILMAESAAVFAKEHVLIRRLGLLRVKGKTQAMAVYEALAELPGSREQIDRKERYEEAFDLYLARDWSRAEDILVRLITDYSYDKPAAKLLDVVREFRSDPPGDDWDGVYTAHEK